MTDSWDQLSAGYRTHERSVRFQNAKIGALISAILILAGSSLDIFVYPEYAMTFFWPRLLSAAFEMGLFLGICRLGQSKISEVFAMLIPVGTIIPIAWMIYAVDGGESTYYAGLNLIAVGLAIVLRWSAWFAFLMSLLTLGIYVIAIYLSPHEATSRIIYNNLYFIAVTGFLVSVGSFFYEKVRKNEYALRKRVEVQNKTLEENQIELKKLDEAKTLFFANVSHELRTPLTIILGTTETLRTQEVDDRKQRYQILHSNGLRLLSMIDNLLDLVRFDQNADQVERHPVDADCFFKGLVSSITYLADRKEISVNYDPADRLPILSLDEEKVEKVVLNLLMNAIKFTGSGGRIDLKVSYDDEVLIFEVTDNGMGMDEEKQEEVFHRFWQADTSANRRFRGSGIGLSLVQSLVEMMAGKVSVESKEGEGSVFTVRIPADRADGELTDLESADPIASLHREAMLNLPEAEAEVDNRTVVEELRSDGFTILVADDEPDLRAFLSAELSREHKVIEARDGVEALELVKQYRPDLVLLDYMMPDRNGMQVCTRMREARELKHIPVIMLTARADEKVKLECLRCGANDFISKPFALGELTLRVQNQLQIIAVQRRLRGKAHELQQALDQLKENEAQMLQQEKMASLGRMSAGIIHEINNPLNYVQGAHHMLGMYSNKLDEGQRELFNDALGDAREGVGRVSQIIEDLRGFTLSNSLSTAPVDLVIVVQKSMTLLKDQLEKGEVAFRNELPDELMIEGNENQLVQIFVNFFQNSIDAIKGRKESETEHEGEIVVEGRQFLHPEHGERVICSVTDNGSGIKPEDQHNIFDPFFTKKDVGAGMGLGLSIVHQIITRHKAEISVESEYGVSTEFNLVFPTPNI